MIDMHIPTEPAAATAAAAACVADAAAAAAAELRWRRRLGADAAAAAAACFRPRPMGSRALSSRASVTAQKENQVVGAENLVPSFPQNLRLQSRKGTVSCSSSHCNFSQQFFAARKTHAGYGNTNTVPPGLRHASWK